MKHILITVISCIAALSAMTSASASKQPNYRVDYNTTLQSYQALNTNAQLHNQFAKSHKGKCGTEKSKSWIATTKSNLAAVTKVRDQLAKSWNQNYKKHTFRDSIKAARDVKMWGTYMVQSKFGTCQKVPTRDAAVDTDLNNVANDLGLPQPYNG